MTGAKVLERLLDLRARVHHERPVAGDRLVKRSSGGEEEAPAARDKLILRTSFGMSRTTQSLHRDHGNVEAPIPADHSDAPDGSSTSALARRASFIIPASQ